MRLYQEIPICSSMYDEVALSQAHIGLSALSLSLHMSWAIRTLVCRWHYFIFASGKSTFFLYSLFVCFWLWAYRVKYLRNRYETLRASIPVKNFQIQFHLVCHHFEMVLDRIKKTNTVSKKNGDFCQAKPK